MKNESRLAKSAAMVSFAASISFLTSFGSEKTPWQDPTVNSINRLPARAVAVPCETPELALAIAKGEKPRTDSKWIESLNGQWDFKWKHSIDVEDWEKSAKIEVPGCWQLQGDYDPALYTNVTYPIAGFEEGDPMAEPPHEYTSHYYRNPVGRYTRTFTVPDGWKNRRTVIHFGGVSSALYLKVNGKDVGYSEDSRLPAEFDITPFLEEGENVLEATVLKHCDGTFLEDQDFWRLSGIFRDVWLVSEQVDAPKDLIVDAELSDDFKTGSLAVRDENGNILLEKKYENPELWSCESPAMYYETLEFNGDFRAVAFGFRKVEIKNSVLYINGQRALFKGTNRHEMEPATGYTVSLEGMKKDIEIFHDLNINAVRTCHYPDDPAWYDLCDREGIYVVCEANLESHGAGYGEKTIAKNPLYRDAHVERGVNMVKTFRNHPSIVVWSMGNEGGDGPNFADEYKAMRQLDKTRPIQYERAAKTDHSDIMCPMYARPWKVEEYVKNNPAKPYILCEYIHAMGNSSGSIDDYWNLVRKYPSAQGGFVWDFVDQAVWKSDERGKWLAYGGDFGDMPNDDNFNCNGIVAADRSYHPGAYEIKHVYQNINVLSWDWEKKRALVANDFRFTSLDGYCGTWTVYSDGKESATGAIDLAGIDPVSKKQIEIPSPEGDTILFSFSRKGEKGSVAHDSFAKPFKPASVPADAELCHAHKFKMNFWRAPTDNDRGWNMQNKCKTWKEATRDQKAPDGANATLVASESQDKTFVELTLDVKKASLSAIPRIGVSFRIPAGYKTVKWFGFGPWENYADREKSAINGVYSANIGLSSGLAGKNGSIAYVENALNPDNYIEPGEQGHRGGCRWVEFSNSEGKTIKISAVNMPFGFSAWPYSQESLENARHQWDLKEEGEITVNIDAVQMGVGGDNSWGDTAHDEYMPGKGVYKLVFCVEGL